MLSPINSATTPYSYYNKDIAFNGKYKRKAPAVCEPSNGLAKKIIDNINSFINDINCRMWVKIRKDVEKQIENDNGNSFIDNLTFWTLSASIAKLFGRKWNLDEYGKLSSIEKYENNELEAVKHFQDSLLRPSSIDEYQNGLISKTTTFYKSPYNKHWIIEYDPAGNNRLREYFPTGDIKKLQYEENDKLNSISYFDKDGNYIKYEKYNPDETLRCAIHYNKDNYIEEQYNHGVLMSKLVSFQDSNIKRNIVYDEHKEVQYIMESGDGYSTYYHYAGGRKDWSETKYKNKNILYKKIEYDRQGYPTVEYHYDRNRKLCVKKELVDPHKIVCTRYNVEGRIIAVEVTDTKTGKTERQYKKAK